MHRQRARSQKWVGGVGSAVAKSGGLLECCRPWRRASGVCLLHAAIPLMRLRRGRFECNPLELD